MVNHIRTHSSMLLHVTFMYMLKISRLLGFCALTASQGCLRLQHLACPLVAEALNRLCPRSPLTIGLHARA